MENHLSSDAVKPKINDEVQFTLSREQIFSIGLAMGAIAALIFLTILPVKSA